MSNLYGTCPMGGLWYVASSVPKKFTDDTGTHAQLKLPPSSDAVPVTHAMGSAVLKMTFAQPAWALGKVQMLL